MDPIIILRWDVHEKDAPRESDRWAASDRGWLFAEVLPRSGHTSIAGTTYVCLGHYLDYETADHGRADHPDKLVHAVSCVTRESRYFATPADARAWLQEQARGKVPAFFADKHNGYEHQKEAFRRMTCDETPRMRAA